MLFPDAGFRKIGQGSLTSGPALALVDGNTFDIGRGCGLRSAANVCPRIRVWRPDPGKLGLLT
jgi:hypothetical protein